MLKSILATAAAVLLTATPAAAAPWQTDVAGHQALVNALREHGVTVSWGPQHCDGVNSGTYQFRNVSIALCVGPKGWTADAFDTLRHEAIHAVQDCVDRRQGNARLHPITTIEQLKQLVAVSGLDASEIIKAYRARGADHQTVLLELEAWSGAATTPANALAGMVRRYCAK